MPFPGAGFQETYGQLAVWDIDRQTGKIMPQAPFPISYPQVEEFDIWVRSNYPDHKSRKHFKHGIEGDKDKSYFCHYIDGPDKRNTCQVCVEFSSELVDTTSDHSINDLRRNGLKDEEYYDASYEIETEIAEPTGAYAHSKNGNIQENRKRVADFFPEPCPEHMKRLKLELPTSCEKSVYTNDSEDYLTNEQYKKFLSAVEQKLDQSFLDVKGTIEVDLSDEFPDIGKVQIYVVGRGQFSVVFAFENWKPSKGIVFRRISDCKTPEDAEQLLLTHKMSMDIYRELGLPTEPTELIIVPSIDNTSSVYFAQRNIPEKELSEHFIKGFFKHGSEKVARTLRARGGSESYDLTYGEASSRILEAVFIQILKNLKELPNTSKAFTLCSDAKPDNFSVDFKFYKQWLLYSKKLGNLERASVDTYTELTDFHPCSLVLFDQLLFDGGPMAKPLEKLLGKNPFDIYKEKIKHWADFETLVKKSLANFISHGGDRAEIYLSELVNLSKNIIRNLWRNDPELAERYQEYLRWKEEGTRAESDKLPVEHLFFELENLTPESILAYRCRSYTNNKKLKLHYKLLSLARKLAPNLFNFKEFIPVDPQQDLWLRIVMARFGDDIKHILRQIINDLSENNSRSDFQQKLQELIEHIISLPELDYEAELLGLMINLTDDNSEPPELYKNVWLRRLFKLHSVELRNAIKRTVSSGGSYTNKADALLNIWPSSAAIHDYARERVGLEKEIFQYLLSIYPLTKKQRLDKKLTKLPEGWVGHFHNWYEEDIEQVLQQVKESVQLHKNSSVEQLMQGNPYTKILISRLSQEYWNMESTIYDYGCETLAKHLPNQSEDSMDMERFMSKLFLAFGTQPEDCQSVQNITRMLVRDPDIISSYTKDHQRLDRPALPEHFRKMREGASVSKSVAVPGINKIIHLTKPAANAKLSGECVSFSGLGKKGINSLLEDWGLKGLTVTHQNPRTLPESYCKLRGKGWEDSRKKLMQHYGVTTNLPMSESIQLLLDSAQPYSAQELASQLLLLKLQDNINFSDNIGRDTVIQALKAMLPHRNQQRIVKHLIVIEMTPAHPRYLLFETEESEQEVTVRQSAISVNKANQLLREVPCEALLTVSRQGNANEPRHEGHWYTLNFSDKDQVQTEKRVADEHQSHEEDQSPPQAQSGSTRAAQSFHVKKRNKLWTEARKLLISSKQTPKLPLDAERQAQAEKIELHARSILHKQLIEVDGDHMCFYNSLAFLLNRNPVIRSVIINKIISDIQRFLNQLQNRETDENIRKVTQGFYRNLIFLSLRSANTQSIIKNIFARWVGSIPHNILEALLKKQLHKLLSKLKQLNFQLSSITIEDIKSLLDNLDTMSIQALQHLLELLVDEAGHTPSFDMMLAGVINHLLAGNPDQHPMFIQQLVDPMLNELQLEDAELTPQLLFIGMGAFALQNLLHSPYPTDDELFKWMYPEQINDQMWGNNTILEQLFTPFLYQAGLPFNIMIVTPAIDNPDATLAAIILQNHPQQAIIQEITHDLNQISAIANDENTLTLFHGGLGDVGITRQGMGAGQHWQPIIPSPIPLQPQIDLAGQSTTLNSTATSELKAINQLRHHDLQMISLINQFSEEEKSHLGMWLSFVCLFVTTVQNK